MTVSATCRINPVEEVVMVEVDLGNEVVEQRNAFVAAVTTSGEPRSDWSQSPTLVLARSSMASVAPAVHAKAYDSETHEGCDCLVQIRSSRIPRMTAREGELMKRASTTKWEASTTKWE